MKQCKNVVNDKWSGTYTLLFFFTFMLWKSIWVIMITLFFYKDPSVPYRLWGFKKPRIWNRKWQQQPSCTWAGCNSEEFQSMKVKCSTVSFNILKLLDQKTINQLAVERRCGICWGQRKTRTTLNIISYRRFKPIPLFLRFSQWISGQ